MLTNIVQKDIKLYVLVPFTYITPCNLSAEMILLNKIKSKPERSLIY